MYKYISKQFTLVQCGTKCIYISKQFTLVQCGTKCIYISETAMQRIK